MTELIIEHLSHVPVPDAPKEEPMTDPGSMKP